MARVVINQTNFTGGELTPRMKGRGDVARYQNGAETIENGVVVVHGGVVRRAGTRYLATAKHGGTRKVRPIRYVLNVEQSFCLEFGHLYVRVFDAATGAVVLNDALATLEITSPYTEDQLAQITTKQAGDVMYLYHPDVAPHLLRRLSATQWVMYAVAFAVQPFAELGHVPAASLSLSATTVGAGRTFTTNPTTVPGAPTIGSATPLNAAASVSFTAPASSGGLPIDYYEVTSAPGGITAIGYGSPIRIGGLTNGVAYTFTVRAHNGLGFSAASAAAAAVTPLASLPGAIITVSSSPLNYYAEVENGTITGIGGPTATGAGGASPYAYAWTKISGDGSITIQRGNTAQVLITSSGFGVTNYATFRCVATDALGASGSVDVTIAIDHYYRENRYEPAPPPGGHTP